MSPVREAAAGNQERALLALGDPLVTTRFRSLPPCSAGPKLALAIISQVHPGRR